MWRTKEEFPTNQYTITPDNDTDLPRPSIIYCGSDGDVVARDKFGTSVTYTVTAGDILPVIVERVLDTGTTVTQLIGLY